jgi:hypothetical protein
LKHYPQEQRVQESHKRDPLEQDQGDRWADSSLHPFFGFDHGVGHPLLLLYDAKAPYSKKSKYFNGLSHYPFNTLYKFIIN